MLITKKQFLEEILKIFKPDIIQCPINIFDNRLTKNNFLKRFSDKGIEIHARSIFLQGLLLQDGNKIPEIKNYKIKSVIKGDQKISEISAASIIAKVSRDNLITNLSKKFKNYGWSKNAGYGTKDHIDAIKKYGITKLHRKTFNPIHNILSLKKLR